MSNQNGLVSSRDVCATGATDSNFFIRKGEQIVIPDPLQIVSTNGDEVLSLGISNAGLANVTNAGGTLAISSQGNLSLASTAGNTSVTTNGLLITSNGNENHNITGSVSVTASAGETHNITGNFGVTASAGETHNITGNFGVTATGTASVIASGNTTVGGQNVFLNGNIISARGYVSASPPDGLTNGSGGVSVSNGTAGTAPNTNYTFWCEGDVPNAGRTPGNLDLIRINGAGSLPLMNITPAGDLTLEPAGATLSAPEVRVVNPPAGVIAPTNTTGQQIQNLRPLLWDSTAKQLVLPSSPLIRFFRVNTPNATGNPVNIIDPQGNSYSSSEWVCSIAGFQNGSGDRTYSAVTIPYSGAPWQALYDTAGSGNQVWILAISTALIGGIQY